MKGTSKISQFIQVFLVFILFVNFLFANDHPMGKGGSFQMGSFSFIISGGKMYEDDRGNRLTFFQANYSYDFFIIPGLALGGKGLWSIESQGNDSFTSWGIGPHIVYFFGKKEPKESVKGDFYPYIGASFIFTKSTLKYENYYYRNIIKSSSTGYIYSFSGGVCYMLTESVGLSVEAIYQQEKMKPEKRKSEIGNKLGLLVGFLIFL